LGNFCRWGFYNRIDTASATESKKTRRLRVGSGWWKLVPPTGAEINCEFPSTVPVISVSPCLTIWINDNWDRQVARKTKQIKKNTLYIYNDIIPFTIIMSDNNNTVRKNGLFVNWLMTSMRMQNFFISTEMVALMCYVDTIYNYSSSSKGLILLTKRNYFQCHCHSVKNQ